MVALDTVFRRAYGRDIESIWSIISQAKEIMRLRGTSQWQDGHPTLDGICDDVNTGKGYVISLGNEVAVYGSIGFDGEPAYDDIRDGGWSSDSPYGVIHKLAVSPAMTGMGLARMFFEQAEKLAVATDVHWLRADTNFDNYAMLKIFDGMGFTYRGKVEYSSGERLAFEKKLTLI